MERNRWYSNSGNDRQTTCTGNSPPAELSDVTARWTVTRLDAVAESRALTVHLPVESVVEVFVSIHVLTDPDSDTEDVGSNALLLNFSTVNLKRYR